MQCLRGVGLWVKMQVRVYNFPQTLKQSNKGSVKMTVMPLLLTMNNVHIFYCLYCKPWAWVHFWVLFQIRIRTLSNMWSFLRKQLTVVSPQPFLQRNLIIYVWLGPKYTSVSHMLFNIFLRLSPRNTHLLNFHLRHMFENWALKRGKGFLATRYHFELMTWQIPSYI